MHAVSSVTEPVLEETCRCTSTPKIFQLYVHGDMKWTEGDHRSGQAGWLRRPGTDGGRSPLQPAGTPHAHALTSPHPAVSPTAGTWPR